MKVMSRSWMEVNEAVVPRRVEAFIAGDSMGVQMASSTWPWYAEAIGE